MWVVFRHDGLSSLRKREEGGLRLLNLLVNFFNLSFVGGFESLDDLGAMFRDDAVDIGDVFVEDGFDGGFLFGGEGHIEGIIAWARVDGFGRM